MKRFVATVGAAAMVLRVTMGSPEGAAAQASVPASLQLGKPLRTHHLTRSKAILAAGNVMPLQGHSYSVQFGSWRYQGMRRGKLRSGQKIDVWEIRINGVTSYSYCPVQPKGQKKAACPHIVRHHFAVLVDDKTGQILQTEAY